MIFFQLPDDEDPGRDRRLRVPHRSLRLRLLLRARHRRRERVPAPGHERRGDVRVLRKDGRGGPRVRILEGGGRSDMIFCGNFHTS